jgi:hypothetical protein
MGDGHDTTELLRELADRQAIAEVLIRYATALDTREWKLLAACFTADAVADYGELGGVNEGLDAIESVVRSLEGFDATQHLIGNIAIDLAGDRASATCYLQAQHVVRGTEGGEGFAIGGTYRDRLVRTNDGWRIAHRTLEPSWQDGNPRVLELAAQRVAAAGRE